MAKVKFKERTVTNKIIVHCSATKPSQDIGAREIRIWHKSNNGWLDIGYHYVIKRDGTIENGRPVEAIGAHCKGQNETSIGICLVGGIDESGKSDSNFTAEQMRSLEALVVTLKAHYPEATVSGHRDYSAKDCPCFDVESYFQTV